MDPRTTTTSRRNFLGLALGAPVLGATLAACGGSGPTSTGAAGGSGGGGSTGTASYWSLSGPPGEAVRTATLKRWNAANPNAQIKGTFFQNDTYKQKIRTAIGAGQAPTILWGWGGGGLKSWVDAGAVEDLTDWFGQNATVKDSLFPSSFGAATINDKIYAMPAETVQPIVLYYNKQVFEKAKVDPPQSWGDIMALVPKFNAMKIAPFSLGGQSLWTNMMWLEFLFDRIGGGETFAAIFNGEKDAWSNPSAIDALTKAQQLVAANGFQKGFQSTTADSNADQALLYTGRAAMMLHGSWSYGIQQAQGGNFVKSGGLGYMNFPPVDGGKGDPSDTVGNPGQYLSISSKASDADKETAKKFFTTQVLSDAENKEWVGTGGVPIKKGTDVLWASSPDKPFLDFVYQVSSEAKQFAQSWDQALDPTAAAALLDNIGKLFAQSISPQQFATTMNGVTGK